MAYSIMYIDAGGINRDGRMVWSEQDAVELVKTSNVDFNLLYHASGPLVGAELFALRNNVKYYYYTKE